MQSVMIPVFPAVELATEADIRLGSVFIRPSRRELLVRGRRLRLEPRVMQVLVALVRAKGGVVSRSELIASCWKGRIVGEDAVYRCIQSLRRLAARERAFCIETIARVGYRLMPADVCENERRRLSGDRHWRGAGAAVGAWLGRVLPRLAR